VANSITPPPELVKQWLTEPEYVSSWNGKCMMLSMTDYRFSNICAKAAQWGADQELEACCKWTAIVGGAEALRATRRPKPPSLKEQALEALVSINSNFHVYGSDIETIRRALEALDD
jgi:hypothetical protein